MSSTIYEIKTDEIVNIGLESIKQDINRTHFVKLHWYYQKDNK